jgi:hypothetical protein
MRLLYSLPEPIRVETGRAIESGKLSLTNVATVQNFIRNEKKISRKAYSAEEKTDLLHSMHGISKRECEKKLFAISTQAVPQERQRVVSATETEVRFVASERLLQKLKRLREVRARTLGQASMAELIEALADLALDRFDPERKIARHDVRKGTSTEIGSGNRCQNKTNNNDDTTTPPAKLNSSTTSTPPAEFERRHPTAQQKRTVWKDHQGQCSFVDPLTKRRCECRYGLEIDHEIPWSKNGATTTKNLRLLCGTHHRLVTVRHFGKASDNST